jgi:hypothetical protein
LMHTSAYTICEDFLVLLPKPPYHSRCTSLSDINGPKIWKLCDSKATLCVWCSSTSSPSIKFLLNSVGGARCGADGWGTALQAGRLRVRFLMVSLECFVDIILPATLWPQGWLSF